MATKPDGAALLRTILEQPADDTARLVYSDWLEEQGDTERAEFIRVQFALAAPEPVRRPRFNFLDRWRTYSQRRQLRRRERQLLTDARWLEWAQPVAQAAGFLGCGEDYRGCWTWVFRRGFVDEANFMLCDWCGYECCCAAYGRPDRRCGLCRGAGRLPAWGPAIVAAQPITTLKIDENGFEIALPTTLQPWQRGPWTKDNLGPAALQWARSVAGLPPLA